MKSPNAQSLLGETIVQRLRDFTNRMQPPAESRELVEAGRKFAASCLLSAPGRRGRIETPSYDEWVGLNLLERDDQLPLRKTP